MSHIPDRAAVLADKLVVNMKEERRANPILPPGLYMNKKPQNLVCHIIRSDQEQGTPEGSSWWDSRWVSHCGCWTSTSIPGGENSLPLSFQVAWKSSTITGGLWPTTNTLYPAWCGQCFGPRFPQSAGELERYWPSELATLGKESLVEWSGGQWGSRNRRSHVSLAGRHQAGLYLFNFLYITHSGLNLSGQLNWRVDKN